MLTEGSDEYPLPITANGIVRLTPRLRERYLTPDVDRAIVQAAGYHLHVWVWSDRENVLLRLPLDGPRFERCYERSINDWGVNVRRWTTPGKTVDGEGVGWFNDASLVVGYGGDSGKEMIRGHVQTFDGREPDV